MSVGGGSVGEVSALFEIFYSLAPGFSCGNVFSCRAYVRREETLRRRLEGSRCKGERIMSNVIGGVLSYLQATRPDLWLGKPGL